MRFGTAPELLATMNPAGTREGTIVIGYRYKWFSSYGRDQIIKNAKVRGLLVEQAPEAKDGFWFRTGELRITGKEPVLYSFLVEVAMAIGETS